MQFMPVLLRCVKGGNTVDLFDDTYSEGVRDLQTFLRVIARSYPSVPFLITDGVYGDKTKSAVR